MKSPKPSSRASAMLLLAGFVVGLGLISWIASGGLGQMGKPPLEVVLTNCPGNQLTISGAIGDCAGPAEDTSATCFVGGRLLDVTISIRGGLGKYVLNVEVDGSYNGPGSYTLPPWPHPRFDANDRVAKVAILQATTGGVWHSRDGEVTVDKNGDLGSVVTDMQFVGGESPQRGLHIEGRWACE